jgi:uncharacterized membrane protein (DUF106 family)
MWVIAYVFNKIFDWIFLPFRSMHPMVGLLVISGLTGIVMLLIFGKTSNQKAIRWTKNKLKAHIAEIWLFRDDIVQMLLAIVRVLGYTTRYLAHSLRPLIFIIVPVIVIMVMLGVRYAHRPFQPGETSIVTVSVDDPAWARGEALQLVGSDGVEVTSPPLRIPQRAEVDWTIQATKPGIHELTLITPSGRVTKEIRVSVGTSPLIALAPSRGRAASGLFLEFPAEQPLPGSSGIRGINVLDWPHRELRILGFGVHWLIAFFVISVAAGFAVKDLFGVEV